jgi:hypothetical protein
MAMMSFTTRESIVIKSLIKKGKTRFTAKKI